MTHHYTGESTEPISQNSLWNIIQNGKVVSDLYWCHGTRRNLPGVPIPSKNSLQIAQRGRIRSILTQVN